MWVEITYPFPNLCGELTRDRWIPRTKGQWRRKCFHLMMSSWVRRSLSFQLCGRNIGLIVHISVRKWCIMGFFSWCIVGFVRWVYAHWCMMKQPLIGTDPCPPRGKISNTWTNALRAELFKGNKNIYLHFMSFLQIDLTQVLKILPQVGAGSTYSI